jgi:methionyl-tRNA formyltransferase
MSLRLVFMGTPDFAVPTLRRIVAGEHEVVAVYTRAPKPKGRGMGVLPSPVEQEAQKLGLPVFSPKTLRTDEAQNAFREHRGEAAVVVAYGLILPKPILDALPRGAFNLHASLLPRWRGAAPINRAIMAGDAETGVMVMKMEEGLDTGPVAMTARVPIPIDATAGDLHDQLARVGADLMSHALEALERGTLDLTPQPSEGVTHAAKIDKNETHIDWSLPARRVHDHIRGLSPFPGAWFETNATGNATRVKVLRTQIDKGEGEPGVVLDDGLEIACGAGAVRILQLQRAGGKPMRSDEFLRGLPLPPGTRLS